MRGADPTASATRCASLRPLALIGLGWKKIIPAGLRHRLRVQARRLAFVNRRPADTVKNVMGIAHPQRLFQLLGEDPEMSMLRCSENFAGVLDAATAEACRASGHAVGRTAPGATR